MLVMEDPLWQSPDSQESDDNQFKALDRAAVDQNSITRRDA